MAIDPSLITDVMSRWQVPQFALPDPLVQYAKIQSLKSGIQQQALQQQALQTGALELQEKQREIAGRAALGEAIRNNISQGADGLPVVNHAAVIGSLAATHPELIEGYQKGVVAQQEADEKLTTAKLQNQTSALELATRAYGAANDQPSWDHAQGVAHGLGVDTAKLGIPDVYSPEAKVQALQFGMKAKEQIDTALAQKKDTREAEKATAELPGVQADTARKVAQQDATALEAAFTRGGPDAFNAALGTLPYARAKVFEGVQNVQDIRGRAMTAEQLTQAEQAAATLKETKRYHDAELENRAAQLGIERQRLWQDKEETKLTPEARDKMAEMFATTGQLPTMGMGRAAAGVRSQVINRAAELYPDVQFATNKAAFQANSQSLKQAQTRMDQVTAAENTAGKNLDVFLDAAKKIVDSGSPWINKPLRALSMQGLGSADMAAANAARLTAIAEIGRVLNNPQGGAAVSDSARKEIQDLIGEDASLKQVFSAAKILRTDMKNRHDAYQGQIDAITQRIGGATGGGDAAAPAAGAGGGGAPRKIVIHASDGQDHPFDTEAQAAEFERKVKAVGGTTSRK